MFIKKQLFRLYFSDEGATKLLSYLGRVSEGNSKDWRTPFYGKADRESILNSWQPILEEIQDKWPTLLEFENGLREKVGPLSIMKPWNNRLEDLESYYESIKKDHFWILSDAARNATMREFSGLLGLRLRSQANTVNVMKKSTNSGCPYFTKRNTVMDQTLPVVLETDSCDPESGKPVNYFQVLSLRKERYGVTAVVGWRGQEGGPSDEDVKQRLIWMFPFAVNIEELRVYQPLIEGCQKLNLVPAWVSMDAVDQRMTRLFDTKGSNDLIVCTDFTKFDQHFNSDLQDAAADLISRILAKNAESRYWMEKVFDIKYRIPIITPSGIRTGYHGMASGSGGTNADETLVHRAMQHEAAIMSHSTLNPNSQCLGDDGCLSFPGINVGKVTSVYESLGLEMNPSKQYADAETAEYLRRWYNKSYRINGICRGVYSTYRAIGRLAGQERFYDPEKWTPEMVELRYLSIIENVKWHPLCEKFADWCMKGDKFRLGLDLPGFFDKIEKYAREAIEYMPDFLGYTKSLQREYNDTGINNWWIVQYLKSK